MGTQINSFFVFFCTDSRQRRYIKTLELRSQLLDTAIAVVDDVNSRWEESRTLVEQKQAEIDALRAALSQAQMLAGSGAPAPTNSNVEEGGGGQDGQ